MAHQPSEKTVLITGAAGQIGYALIPSICDGTIFGIGCTIHLHLLDIEPATRALQGVRMEIEDSAFSCLGSLVVTTNLEEAFSGVDVAILVGGYPRRKGMERSDLIDKNIAIMKEQGQALERFSDHDVKVLVVANPANTNCLTLMEFAPSIPRRNFTCMMRLDQDRLRGALADALQAQDPGFATACQIRNVVIWGNHSPTMVPDSTEAEIAVGGGGYQPLMPVLQQRCPPDVIGSIISDVRVRGATVIQARGLSSALSAARAVGAHLRDWLVTGTAPGEFVTMGVYSDANPYKLALGQGQEPLIPGGLVVGLPCRCWPGGKFEVVPGMLKSDTLQNEMKKTIVELAGERDVARTLLALS
uniref:malate dehydrogenase n=1 Tax=Fibrocapsa japonica TaxID=94617 RepID=A0A7S2UYY3_9STRA|mmetsp:Transcript_21255/g.30833  ORF Transcript_21255/g.30833 Transcript_21255/m.30833 type:complete len:359 (+) Transcript_21255:45-1121(+)|eukprot:CAMPEP_0113939818 /NCGR_PEP_ID=MMETSP1339-20121228/6070_1 /TAXON_ID=94617 /ORGANISM="Fibrocapsa japonica" /LENGTH=358 /DNA_ID=CAMNT_0000943433 /DNA_START=45 /DNA_END=1121 /DNA_ORIENTATION=- /assembly_acc=CAM_ASM_000762